MCGEKEEEGEEGGAGLWIEGGLLFLALPKEFLGKGDKHSISM